jgi:Na+/H+ antiporter NhaD/arsenite permease-like protein
MIHANLNLLSFISIAVVLVMYGFLMAEKINKVIVVGVASFVLIIAQVFKTAGVTSQEGGFSYVAHNLDVLGFIIGMMVMVGVIKESGVFEFIALWLVKKVKGNPRWLLFSLGYLALFMTAFLSNIPTVLILTPLILVLVKELKLPPLPFFLTIITMANIGGAMTPISDPTTYYEAKTAGLSFIEVISNSGVIVLILSMVAMIYMQLVFGKQLAKVEVHPKEIAQFNPRSAIKDTRILKIGTPMLIIAILLMLTKDYIANITGIALDNASISLATATLALFIFNKNPKEILQNVIDWEIIFFFMGLFIVIGSLEHTEVVRALAGFLVTLSHGNANVLQFLITMGSGILSMFIDNVPYNITMVSAIQSMSNAGIFVYPLWWALNLGTSFGGAGSPIGAACNVVTLGIGEKEKIHVKFLKYLGYGFPLVIINGLVTFGILYLRYGMHH